MNEPLENLITNIHAYSRPVSSSKKLTLNSRDLISNRNARVRNIIPNVKTKKERAMTAQTKPGNFNNTNILHDPSANFARNNLFSGNSKNYGPGMTVNSAY